MGARGTGGGSSGGAAQVTHGKLHEQQFAGGGAPEAAADAPKAVAKSAVPQGKKRAFSVGKVKHFCCPTTGRVIRRDNYSFLSPTWFGSFSK